MSQPSIPKGERFVMRADEKLTAFLDLESAMFKTVDGDLYIDGGFQLLAFAPTAKEVTDRPAQYQSDYPHHRVKFPMQHSQNIPSSS